MKKILWLVLLVTGTVTAQNVNTPFYGTWETDINVNQTFRVHLFEDEEGDVAGHYFLIETNANGNETTLYTSKVHLGYGLYLGPLIYGGSNGTELGAGIEDINHQEHKYKRLDGQLTVTISTGSGAVGTTASWTIDKTLGSRFKDDDREFIIPTSLTLTKVSN